MEGSTWRGQAATCDKVVNDKEGLGGSGLKMFILWEGTALGTGQIEIATLYQKLPFSGLTRIPNVIIM